MHIHAFLLILLCATFSQVAYGMERDEPFGRMQRNARRIDLHHNNAFRRYVTIQFLRQQDLDIDQFNVARYEGNALALLLQNQQQYDYHAETFEMIRQGVLPMNREDFVAPRSLSPERKRTR